MLTESCYDSYVCETDLLLMQVHEVQNCQGMQNCKASRGEGKM